MDQALTDSLSLRAAKAIDGDDDNEERAGPSNIFKEFANLLKGKKIDPAKVTPVDPKVYPKLEGRSFDADALPLYVRISEQTAQQRGGLDQYGVGTLVTNMGQEKLMKYINLGLNSKNHVAVATAERLRAGLVSKWKTEMKPVNYVATALKGGKQANSLDNTKVVNTYRALWNEAHAAKLKPNTVG
ncbi:hypothetical protein GN244_ATG20819 [Phytophthora infestans]|uniref:Uncharacterized protein n=1 Tax=Phytophthora infestans TaxID=4787 RepID=A0A833WBY4_PHYIN|nr:hypothetical protein GN244_ATG20819 [Phytophthora infestans]